jgi:hypothetical protein
MPTQTCSTVDTPSRRPSRRLKPEIAARWAAQRRETDLRALYQTPVEKLSPEEIARMKAAFLRG